MPSLVRWDAIAAEREAEQIGHARGGGQKGAVDFPVAHSRGVGGDPRQVQAEVKLQKRGSTRY
ncbi:MAG: hypothetical protein ACKV19_23400 [Verrucomicrobiales bacterium]